MRVSDIATLDVRSCGPDTNLAEIACIMWQQDCGIVPVVGESNTVIGVITDRDICIASATRPMHISQIPARMLMSGLAFTCKLGDDVKDALRTMARYGVRRLPVLDERGTLAGMLSLTDVILASRDAKVAKAGELTWPEVIPSLDAITRPREEKEISAAQRKQAIAARRA